MNDTQRRQADISAGGWVLSVGLAGVAIMLAFAGLWLPNGRAGSSTSSVESKKVAVSLTEFKVTPASIDAEVGQKLVLTVTNDGMMAHDLKVEGTEGTRMLEPGTSETITIGPFDSATEAWCTVAGHKESGMVMAI